jgi:hypothetical protein
MLTAGLRLVHNREIGLVNLLKAMSSRPADLLGLPGGTLRPGSPADVILIDLDVPWVLDPLQLKSKARTRRSTKRACSAAWCEPLWQAAPSTNTSDIIRT